MKALSRHRPKWISRRVALAAVVLAAMALPAQASFERGLEKTLGKQARDAIESQYDVVKKGPAAEYVERIGKTLVEVSPRHDIEYTFKILDTEQINAFALPWGYVYVTTGMLEFVDSSDQLAGVLGHEIAHVAQKHSLDAFKQQFWASLLFGVIDAPATLLTVGQVGTTLYLLRHSRKDEQEADGLGAGYSYAAGYDPSQLSAFLRKLDEEHGRKPSTIEVYLSTHPTGERRQQRLAELPEVNRKNADVATHVAHAFLARHLANQAVVEYRRVIELAPDRAEAHAGLARAYAKLGEPEPAQQAWQRAEELGLRDQEELPDLPTASAPPVVPPSAAEEQQVEQARAAAERWHSQVKEPVREIGNRAKSLENSVQGLARRMSMTGALGSPTLAGERVMEKAQFTLYMIAETSDRVAAVGEGLQAKGDGAAEVVQTIARDSAAPATTVDRAQWTALSAEVAAGIAGAETQAGGIRQQALQAADLADKAASQLSSAVSSLPSAMNVFGAIDRSFAFLGLAEGEVDEALRNAHSALELSGKAMAALRRWRAQELSWRLSAAYLDTPPAHRRALCSMAGAMTGADPDALAGAEGGFGAGLVHAVTAAAESQESPPGNETSKPAEAREAEQNRQADLMLKLVLADVRREAEARRQWQGSAASPPAAVEKPAPAQEAN